MTCTDLKYLLLEILDYMYCCKSLPQDAISLFSMLRVCISA